ncbi:MAG: hypothetical protein COU71_02700, partial [Parcubacteria group bacterium CG10_big_fil_rev_8_21_14_0_10_38_31]
RVHQNPKFFLTIPFSAGGVGRAGKKWKGKFLVLVPPLQYQHTCNISHYCHRTQYLVIIHL